MKLWKHFWAMLPGVTRSIRGPSMARRSSQLGPMRMIFNQWVLGYMHYDHKSLSGMILGVAA